VRIAAEEGRRSSKLLKSQKENIDRPLSAILTLNTIAHTVGAAGVGAQAVAVFGEMYFGVISAILTILILVFSEVIPKTLGARFWRSLALPSASVIRILIYLLYPLVIVSELFTRMIIREKKSESVTREEIAILTRLGTQEGVVKEDEGKLINNILKLKSFKVRDAMTPRTVVKVAQREMSLEAFVNESDFLQFSRVPLYTDSIEDCKDYVLKNDVLKQLVKKESSHRLNEIKRPALIVPESLMISKLFEEFLEKKEHIAIVVDEYGGFEGIITMEDIIETILGLEIQDETDRHQNMQQLAKEKWRIRTKKMNLDLSEEE